MPEGSVKRFARVADWDRGPTEAVNAKNYFTPRLTKRLASAKKRHNHRRASSHKWIRLETTERERQNAVAEAAVEEGVEIVEKYRGIRLQRDEQKRSEHLEVPARTGVNTSTGPNTGAGERLGVQAHRARGERKGMSESGISAKNRRIQAQHNQVSSARKHTVELMA